MNDGKTGGPTATVSRMGMLLPVAAVMLMALLLWSCGHDVAKCAEMADAESLDLAAESARWLVANGRLDQKVVDNQADAFMVKADITPNVAREFAPEPVAGVAPAVAAAPEAETASEVARESASGDRLSHQEIMMLLKGAAARRRANRYEIHFDSMPPGGHKLKINSLGGYLGSVFRDSNKVHLEVAEAVGIAPIYSLAEAWRQAPRLEQLQSCEQYYVDDLSHSLPYLTPNAHKLLKEIGKAFRDSLQQRGGGYYRVKVTSVLRTPKSVRQLRRRNRNAADTSAHLYGTTFDLSYLKFICDSTNIPRTQEDLKNLLGEVLEAQRQRGRCYVKYERKQSCYHITSRY